MWVIPCKCFVCLQLQDALTCLEPCKTTLKHSSRKCCGPYCKTRLPENASCLEGSLHSSGSSGYTLGRTSGRTCSCDRGKQMRPCQLLDVRYEPLQNTNQTTNKTALAITRSFLFMTEVVFCLTIHSGHWERCHLVYPSLSYCHSLP